MNKKNCYVVAILLMFLINVTLQAQLSNKRGLKIGVLNEAIGLPDYRIVKAPLHPGVSIGFVIPWKLKKKSEWNLSLNTAFYYHKKQRSGIYILPEINYSYYPVKGLYFQGSYGIGYLHAFFTEPVYSFKEGKYVTKKNFGSPNMLTTLSFSSGYHIKKILKNGTSVYAKYSLMIEGPFAAKWGVPFGPHTLFETGIVIYPFK